MKVEDAKLAELAKQARKFIEKAAYYFAGPGDCLGYIFIHQKNKRGQTTFNLLLGLAVEH